MASKVSAPKQAPKKTDTKSVGQLAGDIRATAYANRHAVGIKDSAAYKKNWQMRYDSVYSKFLAEGSVKARPQPKAK